MSFITRNIFLFYCKLHSDATLRTPAGVNRTNCSNLVLKLMNTLLERYHYKEFTNITLLNNIKPYPYSN